jgi:hypothetical protein
MKRKYGQNTNLSAEFFVASQLYRLGYTVTITLGHTKEIDLIVAHPDGNIITIDVKGLKNRTNWPLKPKLTSKTHYFALVGYNNKFQDLSNAPEVFIIPSLDIDKLLQKWTARPDVTCVAYRDVKNSEYKDAWHLLFK